MLCNVVYCFSTLFLLGDRECRDFFFDQTTLLETVLVAGTIPRINFGMQIAF